MPPHLWARVASNVATNVSKGWRDESKSLRGGGGNREYYGSSFGSGGSSNMRKSKSLSTNGDDYYGKLPSRAGGISVVGKKIVKSSSM